MTVMSGKYNIILPSCIKSIYPAIFDFAYRFPVEYNGNFWKFSHDSPHVCLNNNISTTISRKLLYLFIYVYWHLIAHWDFLLIFRIWIEKLNREFRSFRWCPIIHRKLKLYYSTMFLFHNFFFYFILFSSFFLFLFEYIRVCSNNPYKIKNWFFYIFFFPRDNQ